MPVLDPRPWFFDYQLAPWLSALQLRAHLVHHAGYVSEVRAAGDFDGLESALEEGRRTNNLKLIRAANQAWNHHMLWLSLSPRGGEVPKRGLLAQANDISSKLRAAAMDVWGSGWAWVTLYKNKIRAVSTPTDERCPGYPLLCVDMWEHAYYLDYIGDRERYVAEIIMNLVNWEFADMRLNGFVPEEIR